MHVAPRLNAGLRMCDPFGVSFPVITGHRSIPEGFRALRNPIVPTDQGHHFMHSLSQMKSSDRAIDRVICILIVHRSKTRTGHTTVAVGSQIQRR